MRRAPTFVAHRAALCRQSARSRAADGALRRLAVHGAAVAPTRHAAVRRRLPRVAVGVDVADVCHAPAAAHGTALARRDPSAPAAGRRDWALLGGAERQAVATRARRADVAPPCVAVGMLLAARTANWEGRETGVRGGEGGGRGGEGRRTGRGRRG